ncbi:MAG: FG-GAP-like repeat-containing protein [Bacteroidia bacterium]|nr:FG-GAP-like repeat-containing protein [Bacteroidia bacterium]
MRISSFSLLISFIVLFFLPEISFAQNEERIFYEHLKLSSQTESLTTILDKTSEFGRGVATIGDLDGDGVTEIVAAAPLDSSGVLWIFFLDKEGAILQKKKIAPGIGGFTGNPSSGGGFGSRIESAGDWDKDGVPDILVCEPRARLGVIEYGAFWLLLLNTDGTVKSHFFYSGRTPGLVGLLAKDQLFGSDIALLNDMDGDGVGEWAVGSAMDPEKGKGNVWIIFPDKEGKIKKSVVIESEAGGFEGTLLRGDQFGISVESLGDLNQDGVEDLAVGAMMDDEAGFNKGAVWILFLNRDGTVKTHQKIISNQNGFSGYIDLDDRFGTSLAKIGDMNGDTIPDLAVSAVSDDDGGKDRGAVYILYMKRDGTVLDNHKISETSRNFEGIFETKYQWAYSISPLGDLNEDGRNDLLVSGQNDAGGKGSVWMLFPAAWPERLRKSGVWAEGAGTFSAEDSAMLYKGARTAEDSARIDSSYDLSGYAPNNLVFLLDVSASMRKPTGLPLLQHAFTELLAYMRPEDKISVITYSGKPSVILSGVPASEQEKIAAAISELVSSGETKPARAVELAYEVAVSHFIQGGNNRIIFATDGGFEIEVLDKPLEKLPSKEIPLSVFYFGKLPAFKISEMNEIARKGFGNSAHITSGSVTTSLLQEVKQIRVKNSQK